MKYCYIIFVVLINKNPKFTHDSCYYKEKCYLKTSCPVSALALSHILEENDDDPFSATQKNGLMHAWRVLKMNLYPNDILNPYHMF